jgi:hypothetical protein
MRTSIYDTIYMVSSLDSVEFVIQIMKKAAKLPRCAPTRRREPSRGPGTPGVRGAEPTRGTDRFRVSPL